MNSYSAVLGLGDDPCNQMQNGPEKPTKAKHSYELCSFKKVKCTYKEMF